MKEFSIGEFVGFLAGMTVAIDGAQREALDEAATLIEKEAKRVIGTYDYGWPELAESTQAERESLGFEPDEPLLRTGELRDSIEHKVIDASEAQVGSNSDIAVYQELGTPTIPPRPFLSSAAAHEADKVAEIIGKRVVEVMAGGRTIARILPRK